MAGYWRKVHFGTSSGRLIHEIDFGKIDFGAKMEGGWGDDDGEPGERREWLWQHGINGAGRVDETPWTRGICVGVEYTKRDPTSSMGHTFNDDLVCVFCKSLYLLHQVSAQRCAERYDKDGQVVEGGEVTFVARDDWFARRRGARWRVS